MEEEKEEEEMEEEKEEEEEEELLYCGGGTVKLGYLWEKHFLQQSCPTNIGIVRGHGLAGDNSGS